MLDGTGFEGEVHRFVSCGDNMKNIINTIGYDLIGKCCMEHNDPECLVFERVSEGRSI